MEIRIEDLFVTCKRCAGSGSIHETHKAGSDFGEAESANEGVSPGCNGQGGTMTSSGIAIRDFLRLLRRERGM